MAVSKIKRFAHDFQKHLTLTARLESWCFARQLFISFAKNNVHQF
jgi:hypothetical protein